MSKYKLINIKTKEEHLCDKMVIDGFDYYVNSSKLLPQDKFISFLIIEPECLCKTVDDCKCEDYKEFNIYTCLLNYKSQFDNHITSIETGRDGDKTKHFIFETDTCKKIIACNNPNIDVPKVVDEVEVLAKKAWGNNLITKGHRIGFVSGYNKSQETHPFSEEDMIEFADFVEKSMYDDEGYTQFKTNKEILQLWKKQQPKIVYYD